MPRNGCSGSRSGRMCVSALTIRCLQPRDAGCDAGGLPIMPITHPVPGSVDPVPGTVRCIINAKTLDPPPPFLSIHPRAPQPVICFAVRHAASVVCNRFPNAAQGQWRCAGIPKEAEHTILHTKLNPPHPSAQHFTPNAALTITRAFEIFILANATMLSVTLCWKHRRLCCRGLARSASRARLMVRHRACNVGYKSANSSSRPFEMQLTRQSSRFPYHMCC
jgi:hypothetical protein